MSSNCTYEERDHQSFVPRCKVFLSHSGIQKPFVEQLCLDVERSDRVPFYDKRHESLPVAEHFPNIIFQSIQQCQVGVLILSEDFFSRTKWPMLELVAMVNLKRHNPNFKIIPVFLGISHSQCRNATSHKRWLVSWDAWAHQDDRIDTQEWKKALEVFGSTNGISCNDLDEVTCRKEIVEAVCKLIPPESSIWDDSHVQGRIRICKKIQSKVNEATLVKNHELPILGLYGGGGIGKTTICKALCNEFNVEFHGKVHHLELENNNKVELIQAMLKRLTEIRHDLLETFSYDQCFNLMKRDFHKRRVFLTIDNVYNEKTMKQAKDLLKVRYAPRSIIIVTARSLELLQDLKIHDKNCIEMPELEEDEAKHLFLHHATPDSEVDEEFVTRCVERCYFGKGDGRSHYHPLALKVLGTQVGYDSEPWNLQFDEMDIFNPLREKEHPIFSVLRKSFDTLLPEDQLLFMDAALFYPERSFFLREWEPLNIFDWLSMMHGISVDVVKKRLMVLKKKSLLEDLGDGSSDIGMHDLWREFCVLETRAGEFKCQRWIYEAMKSSNDRTRIESRLFGGVRENLQNICLMANHGIVTGLEVAFNYCSNVTVLKLQGVVMEDGVLDVSLLKHLKSMECIDMRTTGDNQVDVLGLGELKHLVVLIWDGIPTNSQSVEEIGTLRNLQALQLHSSLGYNNLPILSQSSSLRHVVVDQFNNARTISGFNSRMSDLQYVDIRCCKSLRSCPGIDELVGLEVLNLSRCTRLREVPSLQMLKNLRKLNIFYCGLLEALPGLGGLVGLQELRLIRCMRLWEFPTNMSNLRNLQVLEIEECPVQIIPGLGDLTALQSLRISECDELERLPDIRKLTRLECFDIGYCPKLRELWEGVNSPRAFEVLAEDFHGLPQLETLKLDWIVFELPDLSIFPQLKKLHLRSCGRVTGLVCSQPLTSLEVLRLQQCWSLKVLPDLSGFERLRKFKMWNCGVSLRDEHEVEALMARCNVSIM